MKNEWKTREKFLREIGLFSVQFSKLELGITQLASFTIDDLRYWEVQFESIFGLGLQHKRDLIKKFIKKELEELYPEWEEINNKIGNLNLYRRHLVHGTGESYLFHEEIKTVIKNNGVLESKTFTASDINRLTNQINHVCTGENGILGFFQTKFKTHAIDWHNTQNEQHKRIIYKVNNEILTNWKGKTD